MFKQSCYHFGEHSMTCVDAKVGNGFLVGLHIVRYCVTP